LSRTPGAVRGPPPERGGRGREALDAWGFTAEEVERLASLGVGFSA
jgi:crotonobetainyl-CoA:carnitine CoA-transferase CaiB-like acyl-CoA transferase